MQPPAPIWPLDSLPRADYHDTPGWGELSFAGVVMKKLALIVFAALLAPAFIYTPAAAQDAKDTEARPEFPAQNPDAKAPDTQPEKGPGGSKYAHTVVTVHEGPRDKKTILDHFSKQNP